MDELLIIKKRHKNRMNEVLEQKPKSNNKISLIFSKILLSIIFILISSIYIHLDSKNKEIYKKYIFETNITFARINEWYQKTFGSILPTVKIPDDGMVNKEVNINSMENYLDGYKVSTKKNTPIKALDSGILVYIGEKDGYGNTAIIQGVNGVDIWYGNVTDLNVKMYDYIDKDTIIGNAIDEYYYQVYYKEGNVLSYENYLKEI